MNEQLSKRTAEADKRVGAAVRAARVRAGLSQSKLAAELGITFQQLQKYEKGRNRVAVSTLLLIADALSVPVRSFFDEMGLRGAEADPAAEALSEDDLRLVRAFSAVGDPEARRHIMGLIAAAGPAGGACAP